ncbi:MAG: heme o synthase [Alphaproteobacteria bacterium]
MLDLDKLRYFTLIAKPGIVLSNALTLIAGYFLAARWNFNFWLFICSTLGIMLIVASACVFNNIIDRDIDVLMSRTKNRVSLDQLYPTWVAFAYGIALVFIGFVLLWFGTNTLATMLALVGFAIYVLAYTLFFKRHSVHGTLIGAFSGSIPPVVGYVAVTGKIDAIAILLYVALILWQMVHFYAIAIYRLNDYKAANIRVRPAICGLLDTKIHIICYATALLCITLMLGFAANLSIIYKASMAIVGTLLIILCRMGFDTKDDIAWGRKVFVFSIIEITIFSVSILLSVSNTDLPI